MKVIKSKCNKFDILVDDDNYQQVMDFAPNGWTAKFTTGSNNPYAVTRKTVIVDGKKIRKNFYLHRLVMDVLNSPIPHIDHKNNNPLDNQKDNLRPVSRSENMKNRTAKKNGQSKYLGVSYDKSKRGSKRFRAAIKLPHMKGSIHLGHYYDEDSAAYAYNLAAPICHGEYANLNDVDMNNVMYSGNIMDYVEGVMEKHNLTLV